MAKIIISFVVCLAMFGSMALAAGSCPQANGTYPVSGSCDAYIECHNGVAEEKLCPDGLLFNEKSTGYPCGYPIDVECSQGQARLQAAQPTDECPHQFGYYRMGDDKNCGQFKNCASGRGYIFDCPDGLAWNPETYRCDWPDQVEDCDAEAFLGFKCPDLPARSSLLGEPEEEYTFYPNSNNCQQYYLCIQGRPRRISCGADQAFNEELKQCDDIENVNTCSADIKQRGIEIKNARLAAAQARAQAKAGQKTPLAFSCPEKNGRFATEEQCDAYIQCQDGVAEEKLCPDGLVFQQRTKTAGDCTYAPFASCKERARLQPANGTEECPRQFGFYPTEDPANCGFYRNCAHGVSTLTKCPEGLAFDVDSYKCDWPDLVKDCNAEAFLGFTCPPPEVVDGVKLHVDVTSDGEVQYFPHPNSCKKYFVCVNGHPRLYNCGRYLAFNPETKLCDFYRNIPECYARLKEKKERQN